MMMGADPSSGLVESVPGSLRFLASFPAAATTTTPLPMAYCTALYAAHCGSPHRTRLAASSRPE